MDINELITIVKKKLLSQINIESIKIEDKSYLHKNHKSNKEGKFHIKLTIKSPELKRGNMVDSNKFIFKIISNELKHNIHSIQILFL